MYQATITRFFAGTVNLGPTDTRDEAARLARSWMDAHPHTQTGSAGEVCSVVIDRAEDAEDE